MGLGVWSSFTKLSSVQAFQLDVLRVSQLICAAGCPSGFPAAAPLRLRASCQPMPFVGTNVLEIGRHHMRYELERAQRHRTSFVEQCSIACSGQVLRGTFGSSNCSVRESVPSLPPSCHCSPGGLTRRRTRAMTTRTKAAALKKEGRH